MKTSLNKPYNTVRKPLIQLNLQHFARKFKVALSDGHGHLTAGKRTPDGYRENYFNEAVIELLKIELIRCGFEILLLAPSTADTPLKERTDKANAWGADVYVSVHYNAISSSWRTGEGGIETYHYPNSASGKKLADFLHTEVIKGTPLRNRGVRSANFHELRESKMPAALLELGFMDIKKEADLMKSLAYRKECAVEIAQGLCKYFGVAYVPEVAGIPQGVSVVGYATIKADLLNVRSSATLEGKILGTVPKGKKVNVYSVSGHWYKIQYGSLVGWISNSGGKYATYEVKPIPIPKPVAKPKPVDEPKGDIYRVYIDGVKVGAFADESNIINQAETAIEKGAKNIKLEKVS